MDREHVLAIQILVQAIVVAGAVFQQQRRRPDLPRRVALGEPVVEPRRKPPVLAEPFAPAVGYPGARRVQPPAPRLTPPPPRLGEISVPPRPLARSDPSPRSSTSASSPNYVR